MDCVIRRSSRTLVSAKRQVQQRHQQRRTLQESSWHGDLCSTVCRIPTTASTLPPRSSIIDYRRTRRNENQHHSRIPATIRQVSTLREAATPTSVLHEDNTHIASATTAASFDRSLLFSSLEDENKKNTTKQILYGDERTSSESKLLITSSIKDDDKNEKSSTDPPCLFVHNDSTPLQILLSHYRSQHGIRIPLNVYDESGAFVVHQWPGASRNQGPWSASFCCPVSGRLFPAGHLTWPVHAEKFPPLELDINEAGKNDDDNNKDRVWYARKFRALQAAAARALDVIQYEMVQRREPRFCREDPAGDMVMPSPPDSLSSQHVAEGLSTGPNLPLTDPSEPVLPNTKVDQKQEYHTVNLGISTAYSPLHRLLEKTGSASEFNVESSLSSSLRTRITSPAASVVSTEYDDEHSYQLVPIGTSGKKSPLHRLLEVASSSTVMQTDPSGKERGFRNPLKTSVTGIQKVKSAIAAADAWVTSTAEILSPEKNKNVHRLYLPKQVSSTTLLAAKVILRSLADANQSLPVDSTSGVELWAKNILSILWRTENAQPDADTYNLYLKCLSGNDPQSRLEEALCIFVAMKNGEAYKSSGNILPKPNQGTANSIISLTAQLGGTKGRIPNHMDDSFVPDRESFLSVLSSCIYRPVDENEVGGFDPVFAKECIQRMTELAAETKDEMLKPDTQVYNSPLRWTGGPVLWAESRPYARYIPWENYETIYMNGLRETISDDDSRVRQAKDTEAWLNMMQELSTKEENVAPDIETYEAVIQAWLKTASRGGLVRAESLVHGILRMPSSVKARIQTLHPLIASWYHSGDPNTLLKVLYWTEDLAEFDPELADRLRADPRIIEIRMMAFIAEQKRLLQMMKTSSDAKQQLSEVFDAAIECSNILKDSCVRLEHQRCGLDDGDLYLGIHLFEHCAHAWKNASTACDISGGTYFLDQIAAEVVHQFDIFESMTRVIAAEVPKGIGPGTHQQISMQFGHIVACAHQFFFVLLEVLVSLEEQRARGSSLISARTLFMLEKMIRMVGEFEEIDSLTSLNADSISPRDNTWDEAGSSDCFTLFTDNFSYRVNDDNRLFSPTRYSLLWQAVKYLEETPLDIAGKGELARLGFLIKTVGKKLRYSPKMEEAVDKILDRNLPGAPSPPRVISDELAQSVRDEKKRRSRIGKGRHTSKTTKNRRHASACNITKGKKMGSAL